MIRLPGRLETRSRHLVCCGARDLDGTRALNPSLLTFDQWLAQNKSRLPLE